MRFLRYNTAVIVPLGPFLDKTDGVTLENALTIANERITFIVGLNNGSAPTVVLDDVTGATSGTDNDLNYVTGANDATMQLELTGANVSYLGFGRITVTDAVNHCPVWEDVCILPQQIFDSLFLGTDLLDANASQIGGTTQTGRDLGASVLLSSGTGAGQVSLASGAVLLQATQSGVTIPTVTTVTNQLSAATIAAEVWGTATRTLTAATNLTVDIAAAVWAAATRTLTAVADSSGITTLLSRVVGTLAAGTHNPQGGDAFARLGAPAGASISADVAAAKSDLMTLLDRITATRAGYLDNLSGGAVAQQSSLASVAGYLDTEIQSILTVAEKLDGALELNGGLYRLTVAALANAPSGSGLTAQQTRDAMKLAPTAGVADTGSLDDLVSAAATAASSAADEAGAAALAASRTPFRVCAATCLSSDRLTSLSATIISSSMVAGQGLVVYFVSTTDVGSEPRVGNFDHLGVFTHNEIAWPTDTEFETLSIVKIENAANGIEVATPTVIDLTLHSNELPPNGQTIRITIPGTNPAGDDRCWYVKPDGSLVRCGAGLVAGTIPIYATESAPGAIETAAGAGGGTSTPTIVPVHISTEQE